MYDVIEMHLPLGQDDWAEVALDMNRRLYGEDRPTRDPESLRQKHKHLRGAKKPTGDPDCPVEVTSGKESPKAY